MCTAVVCFEGYVGLSTVSTVGGLHTLFNYIILSFYFFICSKKLKDVLLLFHLYYLM